MGTDDPTLGCCDCDREITFGGCSDDLMAVLGNDKVTATAYAAIQMGWGITDENQMICPNCLTALATVQ